MNFAAALQQRLSDLAQAHLTRQLLAIDRVQSVHLTANRQSLLSFASNDYLGLSQHPAVVQAALAATQIWGAGSTASRLVSGSLAPHHELERLLAEFKSTQAARAFSSGYATALGVIPALVGPGDFVILDRLAHACLVDAARLSGARLRVFRHNDLEDLARILRWTADRRIPAPGRAAGEVLVVTESVFSMDGDRAPLADLAALALSRDAWLFVDEAHATGVIGPGRQGLLEEVGLGGRIEVAMGTLGKALGAAGGFVAGSRVLCDYLLHRARSFLFSTAPPPAAAAAASAAIRIVQSTEGADLAERLWLNLAAIHHGLLELGWDLPAPVSPIVPLVLGPEQAAIDLANALRAQGILIPAIRYPTVARGKARLRLSVSAAHSRADIDRLLAALRGVRDRTGIRPSPA